MSCIRAGLRARSGIIALALAGVGLTLAPAVSAHHGWSTYGVDNFVLEGEVTELRFGNPHDRMTVVAEGVEWDVWLGPPGRNARALFNDTKVAVGDTVIAYGDRKTDLDINEMKTERITVIKPDGSELTYDLYPERLES